MTSILIGGDVCPIAGNEFYFERGDAESLFHDLLPELAAADLAIANLECPFIKKPSPIRKTGPTFGVPGACIKGIKASGIHVLGLANNHIMDHGIQGLQHTLEVCESVGIMTVGGGVNLDAASRLVVLESGGLRIGLLAMAEHEFSVASKTLGGANPLDIIAFVRTVVRHRAEFDYLIVLYHGADEFHAPTPRVQEMCRFMVEQGAHAVIVQHPHVLGGWENYLNGHIVYGQGALVMDEPVYRNRTSFHRGFLVKLSFDGPERGSAMEILPFMQSDPVPGARRLPEEEERKLLEDLEARASRLTDPAFVESEWRKFCSGISDGALSSLLGHGRFARRFGKQGWLQRRLKNDDRMLAVRNMVMCETHREKLETIFREQVG